VRFDWDDTPLHWIPGEPLATHVTNVLHLLLPAGERWFVHVFKQALPLITDERLRAEVVGFMGQEGTHAAAHARVLDHLRAQGIDPDPYLRDVDWLFRWVLGDDFLPPGLRAWWLRDRIALVAAMEHFTAVLGHWVLTADYERAGADPMMVDLLRWHGAEEVEHRAVAFDMYAHVSGSYFMRVRTMLIVAPIMAWLWVRGTRYLMARDPELRRDHQDLRPRLRDLRRAMKRGLVPGFRPVLASIPRYLRRDYHPSQVGSTQQALDYLAISPAARASEG
jgi:predicted metal-dependent hydrolase